MENSVYELNLMPNPYLPFRIRRGINARNAVPLNWHENTEILYCVAGTGYIQYNAKRYAVEPGDMVVVNSEMIHTVTTEESLEYCCLIIDRHFCFDSAIPSTKLVFQELIRDPALSRAFLRIYDAHARYEQTQKFYEIAAVRAAVLDFLYLLCRDHIAEENSSVVPHHGETVKTAVIYMKKHLSEPLTLDGIADHVGVNKYHLSRLFKKVLGRTVFETIRVLRCHEAKQRIEQGMSVTEAAHSCGFENLSYFTRTFKKHHGILPSRCARQQQPVGK